MQTHSHHYENVKPRLTGSATAPSPSAHATGGMQTPEWLKNTCADSLAEKLRAFPCIIITGTNPHDRDLAFFSMRAFDFVNESQQYHPTPLVGMPTSRRIEDNLGGTAHASGTRVRSCLSLALHLCAALQPVAYLLFSFAHSGLPS